MLFRRFFNYFYDKRTHEFKDLIFFRTYFGVLQNKRAFLKDVFFLYF